MNNDSQRFSNELGRIPCPLCRYNMRLKLSLRLLMTQYNDLCQQCKDKMSYIEDKRCICREKTRAPADQEKNELYRRIKNFYKSIVPSPKLIHKTKILPFLDEYNPFKSLSVPNFSEYDTKSRQMKLADSEPNLSMGRPSDDRPFRKYDQTDIKETFQKTHSKYRSDDEDRKKSDRDYGSSRDREYSPSKDREHGATRDRDYRPSTDRDYGPSRDRDYGPTTDREHRPSKDREHGATRDRDYRSPRGDQDVGPSRDRDKGATRDREYGPTRDRDYGPSKDRGHRGKDVTSTEGPKGISRAADRGALDSNDDRHAKLAKEKTDKSEGETLNKRRDVGGGATGKGMDANQAKAKTERDGDETKVKKGKYGDEVQATKGKSGGKETSDNEWKVKKEANANKQKNMSESKPKKEKDTSEKVVYAQRGQGVFEAKEKPDKDGEKVKTAEKRKDVSEGKEKKEKDVDKGKHAVIDKDVAEGKVKKTKDASKEKPANNENNVAEVKVKNSKEVEKEKGITDGKPKKEKDGEKIKYAQRGQGVFEAKEKPDKDGEKVKTAEKRKDVSEGKEKKEKDVDKGKHAVIDKDVAEGKVKKTKDASKEKPANNENNVAEVKVKNSKEVEKEKGITDGKPKKEKDGEKIKYAERGKGVFESKVKRENDGDKEESEGKAKKGKEGDKRKVKKGPSGDKEKEGNEGKGKAEKYDKDKEDDEEKGKKLQHNEREIEITKKDKNQIELDVLSFSERRELNKKIGGAHKKKAAHKEKKGKGKDKDGDKKTDEQKKKPKSEPSDDEHEPDKEKHKSKKKDAEIDDDMATPLTYTENTSRQAVNPYLVKGAKKPKRKVSKKSIGKKSVLSNEKIMRPIVKPKILELIKKLTKSPRVRDKYFDRESSRGSRRLQFDEGYRSYESEKSFLELLNTPSARKFHKVIVGNRVIKYKPMHKSSESEDISMSVKPRVYVKYEEKPAQLAKDTMKTSIDTNPNDLGVLCYSLSDRSFISKGYTILPTEKIMRKLNVYRMRPSNPNNDWFARNRRKKTINYTSGQKLAVFEGDERCRIFYKNGNVALDYYQAEDNQAQERIVIYSDGENELKQKEPVAMLATFDHMGTGVIFDKKGNVRAKYNQNEGVVLDRTLGPYTKWKWHKLNDPPVLEEMMVDTVLPNKDPRILRMPSKEQLPRVVDEQLLEIEFQNSLKEKGKKIFKSFKPFPVKMKVFKINDQFSLHIMDQSKIYLSFRDGSTSFRIDVGMILDCNEIIDMETSEMGEVVVPIELKPARTSSLHNLQRSVEQAKQQERKRLKRSQRQHPLVEPCQSLDRMRSAISRPLLKQVQGHPSDPVIPCPCRKNTI